MKKVSITLCLLVIAMYSCNTTKTEKTDSDSREEKEVGLTRKEEKKSIETVNYRVSDKSAGDFKIGDPIPSPSSEPLNIKSETRTETAEGETYEETIYMISRNGEALLELLSGYNETGDETNNIGEIVVFSAQFKTAKGIGIGSTLEEFIKTYPKYKLWYTYVSGMYVVETEGLAVQFILSADDFTGKTEITSDMIMLNPSDFKPNAKIVKLRII